MFCVHFYETCVKHPLIKIKKRGNTRRCLNQCCVTRVLFVCDLDSVHFLWTRTRGLWVCDSMTRAESRMSPSNSAVNTLLMWWFDWCEWFDWLVGCLDSGWFDWWNYRIRHIFRGFFIIAKISRVGCYSRIQQHAKINLPPIPTQECNLCIIRNTSSTVHSACANEWMILISQTCPWLLSSSIANLTTRGNVLKSKFAKN